MNSTKQYANIKNYPFGLILFTILLIPLCPVFSQTAKVTEELITLKTYPFNDPDPVPIIFNKSKVYPYHQFDGYSHTGKDKKWKVVKLENDYVQVFILPEVGGKVWGAIEKSTGEEFIYRNEVMKFRNIAMRGPWTSGGIEFNFGIIGHSPSTASPVDYMTRENEDGSVSCIVGNLDLPSRTYWSIDIRLPKDKAYFETRVTWYNPTPLNQSYYNWMTASAGTGDDLEFFCPGNLYLEHSGEAKLWPVDSKGREISYYKNNAFGPSKSYHVVGELNNFFGGYFHDKEFGYGHWAPYEEMPGQKLWLWALSRSGGIWEDLLTDTDGQYIEFQAGRLLNQYSPGSHSNPITQVGFEPHASDTWREIWFPFKEINGMVAVSPYGVLNIEESGDKSTLSINALQKIDAPLKIKVNKKLVFSEQIMLNPMEIYTYDLPAKSSTGIEVMLGDRLLHYSGNKDSLTIKRPFNPDKNVQLSREQWLYNQGTEAKNYREYKEAILSFRELLNTDSSHTGALLAMAELYYRQGKYDQVLSFANQVLDVGTYTPGANYWAGLAYRAKGDLVDALESFGWAARSMQYRSVSYFQMAEIYAYIKDYSIAGSYAKKALDFNAYNIPAHQLQIVSARKMKNPEAFIESVERLNEIDPLNHFARFETFLNREGVETKKGFLSGITNEFPAETHLEIAIQYYHIGLIDEAILVLSMGPKNVKNNLWMAYLSRSADPSKSRVLMDQCLEASTDFIYPYRIETLEVLEWATDLKDSWKLDYYLALNYLAVGRNEEAVYLLTGCGGNPDSWVFYLVRSEVEMIPDKRLEDLKEAVDLAPEEWRTWNRMVEYLIDIQDYEQAFEFAKKGSVKFPGNNTIGFSYAKSLYHNWKYEECIEKLNDMVILPFEGSNESRNVYENAHVRLSLKLIKEENFDQAIKILKNVLEWPENLGVGKPYDPDERRQQYLLGYCYQMVDNKVESSKMYKEVIAFTQSTLQKSNPNHILGLMSMKKLGSKVEASEMMKTVQENEDHYSDLSSWLVAVNEDNMNELYNLSDMYGIIEEYNMIFDIYTATK